MIALLWPSNRRRRNPMLAAYAFVLFGLGTVFMAMNIRISQLGFIDNREYPDGPEAYQDSLFGSLAVTPNTVFIIANWLADALLVSRLPAPVACDIS